MSQIYLAILTAIVHAHSEVLAAVITLQVASDDAANAPATAWLDNQPGMQAIIKGYSRDECLNDLVREFWLSSAAVGADPWVRFCYSENNPADSASRGCRARADALGWHWMGLEEVRATLLTDLRSRTASEAAGRAGGRG